MRGFLSQQPQRLAPGAHAVEAHLQMPALHIAMSAAGILIGSGLILFDTSRIILGGETNYIRATVALYMDIYYVFVHLLSLLGIMDD